MMTTVMIVFMSCSEEEGHGPLSQSTTPPGIVQNVSIENLPGKSRLTYDLPNDIDLSYVVARYTTENGTMREVKASYFNNTMLLEGFKGLVPIEVTIKAVNKGELESEPVIVIVNPLEAPIFEVFESLEVGPDFGGIYVKASNPVEEDIAIYVMLKDSLGDWEPLPTSIYTKSNEIDRKIRNLDTISQTFAFAVRDRWFNVTDTLFTEIKPYYEQEMPKSQFVGYDLPSDGPTVYPISNLWNNGSDEYYDSYFTERNENDPYHLVTFGIGQIAKLSRIHIYNFGEPIGTPPQRYYFYLGAMKKFRIYGSNELIDDINQWTLMGEYEVVKPSGLPYLQENAADTEAGELGVECLIDVDKPAVRYLRIMCIENWAGLEYMSVNELEVYGNPNF